MVDKKTTVVPDGPPTTARLRKVLERASRVVIADGSPDEVGSAGVPQITVSGTEIGDLSRLLAIVDGGNGDQCRCLGWPTILVYSAHDELIACWTLHHQTGIRGVGDCDADLVDGPALTDWLAEHGLTGSRDVQARLAVQRAEEEQHRIRWIQAAPAGLAEAAEAVARPPERDYMSWSHHQGTAQDRLSAQMRHLYPETVERIRALLAWAGLPSQKTGGRLWYELAVERLLLAEPTDAIFAALTTRPPSPAHLNGAAQLFGSLEWTTAHGRQLPEPVRTILITHIQANGTDPMRFRLRHGYYGATPAD